MCMSCDKEMCGCMESTNVHPHAVNIKGQEAILKLQRSYGPISQDAAGQIPLTFSAQNYVRRILIGLFFGQFSV